MSFTRSTPTGNKGDFRPWERIALRTSCEIMESVITNLFARTPSILCRHQDGCAVENVLPYLLLARRSRYNLASPSLGNALAKFGRDLPRPQKFSQPIALAARLRYDDRMRHCRRRKKKRMLGRRSESFQRQKLYKMFFF